MVSEDEDEPKLQSTLNASPKSALVKEERCKDLAIPLACTSIKTENGDEHTQTLNRIIYEYQVRQAEDKKSVNKFVSIYIILSSKTFQKKNVPFLCYLLFGFANIDLVILCSYNANLKLNNLRTFTFNLI